MKLKWLVDQKLQMQTKYRTNRQLVTNQDPLLMEEDMALIFHQAPLDLVVSLAHLDSPDL